MNGFMYLMEALYVTKLEIYLTVVEPLFVGYFDGVLKTLRSSKLKSASWRHVHVITTDKVEQKVS